MLFSCVLVPSCFRFTHVHTWKLPTSNTDQLYWNNGSEDIGLCTGNQLGMNSVWKILLMTGHSELFKLYHSHWQNKKWRH